MDKFGDKILSEIDDAKQELYTLSKNIWRNPELMFNEHFAHELLTTFSSKYGFVVTPNFVSATGFKAELGSTADGPHIAILCEYDALPEIGHACGHNLIAEAGVAAGIGLAAAMKTSDKPIGKLTVLGTPAEEGGGGKIDMIRAGVFDDVDAAMMVHPSPDTVAHTSTMAIDRVTVKYHGKSVHAASYPWDGVNALDAAVLCYQNVSCLRQQLKPTWKVHGIIKNGGVKANLIPNFTELEYHFRTSDASEISVLKSKLKRCFESAAIATGCKVEYSFSPKPYMNLVTNSTMADTYKKHAESLGVQFDNVSGASAASTDMGNVSQVVPSIHPAYGIGSKSVNHTKEFAKAAGDEKAQSYTIAQAKAMALTALDLFTNTELMTRVKEEFDQQKQKTEQKYD